MDRLALSPPTTTLVKILVVGADSTIGANLAMAWSRRATVVGLARESCAPCGVCARLWTPHRRDLAGEIIRGERPGWVVYCGPIARSRWDLHASDEDPADQQSLCAAVAQASRSVGAHLTVLSTDAVFSGPRLFHAETSRAASRGAWAKAAGRIEKALARAALLVRTCAYGWGPPGSPATFAERIWHALRDGIPWPADPDCFATPVLATDLAEPLWNAMRRKATGLYHAGGAERVSGHRFAVALAQMASLPHDASAIPPHWVEEAGVDSSLDSRLLAGVVSWTPPMLREGLARFLRQREDGWRRRLGGRNPAAERNLVAGRCDAA
jgi:dTDP-4-dehydrorhamnose reductase